MNSRPPKVAIVVPVYNPGLELERCVASVLAQTMPPDDLEAVFVDDGSTDGSGDRLDRLAAEHAHVRVIHEPNSGWAGRPRNVGIDAATAEFVLFLDHDDALGPEAAARLYARAVADGSDIVLGRSVGHGKPNESSRDWATRGPVTFEQAPELIAHLKPHKLVRREFLDARGLRFHEGRRRLEDQAFVLEAYFGAKAISVVGDYVCYHHHRRADRANAASQAWLPADYYRYVRENLEIIERHTAPGAFRNRLLARVVRGELLSRLAGRPFLNATPDRQAKLLAEIRPILEDHVPAEVDATLGPALGAVAALTRSDRLDLLIALSEAAERTRATARLRSLTWASDGGLELEVDVALDASGGGLGLAPLDDGRWALEVPAPFAAVVPATRLASERPIGNVLDAVAVDGEGIATSLPATARFATNGSAVRVSIHVPPVDAVARRLAVWLTVLPRRLRLPIAVPGGVALPARNGIEPIRDSSGHLVVGPPTRGVNQRASAVAVRIRRAVAHRLGRRRVDRSR